jgi:hypothetical protein
MYKKHEIHNKELIGKLNGELEEIKRKISSLRKKGVDTKIVEYKIMNLPSKIKMASITNKDIDVIMIRTMYKNCIADLDFLEKQYEGEQKKIIYMEELLNKALTLLKTKQLRDCLPLYYEIRNFYKVLSIESKQKVLDSCIQFYSEFQELAK